jgi:cytochrome P450
MTRLPIFRQDPRDADFVQDPYAAYDVMRRLGPLVVWEDYGFPVSARYDVVSALLRDRRLGRDVSPVTSPQALGRPEVPEHVKPFYDFEKASLLESEPPVHTRLRGLVNRAFVTRAIERLRPGISALCNGLIDRFEPDGANDLLASYATPIPVIVIAELIGLPVEDAGLLLDWSHRMVAMYQFGRTRATEDAAVDATRDFSRYIRDHLAERRRRPTEDLMSALIAARDSADRLSEDELVTTIVLLMNAGHEATVHAIGNAVALLLDLKSRASDSWVKVLAAFDDAAATVALVEETLRFDPPLHLFTRYVLEPMELFGAEFAIGDTIGLLLGAANRDPDAFPQPAAFQPDRYRWAGGVPQPLSFGAGIHFCLGAPLARLELAIALPILFARLPHLRLARAPQVCDAYHFHGYQRLDVTW